jgi:hypothetical protein
MTYFARVIEVITRTGGEVSDVVQVEAAHGGEAVERICEAMRVAEWRVYLITEEEASGWAAIGVPVHEIEVNKKEA